MARIAIIGAGIVGLACARQLLLQGHKVEIFDRDPEGDKCSWGNAGGIAVTEVVPAAMPGVVWRIPHWLVDPLGPLSLDPLHAPAMTPWVLRFLHSARMSEVRRISAALAALLCRVYDDLLPLLDELDLANNLYRRGALTVYEHAAGYAKEALVWEIRRGHDIVSDYVSGDEARELEPALGANIACGVFMPAWSTVADPKRIWRSLLDYARGHGAIVHRQELRALGNTGELHLDSGPAKFDSIVVAGGAWSARLARSVGDKALLESERGYNTTIADPAVTITRKIIFGEGKFVASPLEIGLRIGGAAEFAGLTRPANYARADRLARLARSYLPGLKTETGTKWMGNRPTTPDSLPVIGRSPRRPDVIYAFGHGHLGLTLGATTGRVVGDLVAGRNSGIDLAPYSIGRF